jgi:F-type H+-transporting ATPase subunit b
MMTSVRQACAARRRGCSLGRLALAVALAMALASTLSRGAVDRIVPPLEASMRQPPPAGESAPSGTSERHDAAEGEADSGLWMVLGKIVNSTILVGTLVYFLRVPITQYLDERLTQVRQDLVTAADMRASASAELDKLERRLAELPGEIEALESRGAQDLADEEARIRQTTDVLRERLISQMRREIDLQAMMAERELLEQTADLAVRLADERIRRDVTAGDQLRLIDRYVEQVRAES